MSEVIQDNFNGLKAGDVNEDALKNIIDQFIKEKQQFDSGKIREFALRNFSNGIITDKYLEVYKNLLYC